jgi:hypothetical protein
MTTPPSPNAVKRIAKWKEIDFPAIYANMMGIGMTPFDINLIFGEVLESDEKSLTGRPLVKVLLAPEQAANLVKLLSIALESYGTTNGALRTAGAIDVKEMTEQMIQAQKPKKENEG